MATEHLDTLDTMLERLAEIEKTVRPLLDEMQVITRKAKARVRALRRGIGPVTDCDVKADCCKRPSLHVCPGGCENDD